MLWKNINDTVSDDWIKTNDSIVFTETKINLSDSSCKIFQTLIFLDIGFNNNEDKLLHLAYGYRENVAVLDKFDVNGVSS